MSTVPTGKKPGKKIPRADATAAKIRDEIEGLDRMADVDRRRLNGEIPAALTNGMAFFMAIWTLRNRLMLFLHASGKDWKTCECLTQLEAAAFEARTNVIQQFFEASDADVRAINLSLILKGTVYKVPDSIEAMATMAGRST